MGLSDALKAEAIGRAALEVAPSERADFVERRCAGDAKLRAEVDFFIAAQAASRATETLPAAGARVVVDNSPKAERAGRRHPERIGAYRILEQIGQGGFGVVYLAEQESPVRRRVALKVIRLGMDTPEVLARFEAERQALAMMDHPGVARVFDAGTTEQGRPYFAMEFVQGVPIVEYCDKQRLNNRERLELFVHVCEAIQHAHQKGIIHRDLKPSNILVSIQDERPVPKVIDFGIAKALHQRLTEHTIYTERGQIIGTPEYMSPEQAEMSGLDIDTRTDIYSLGVILYQLLSGSLPFDSAELRKAGMLEIQRVIREQEPPKPSTKLGTLAEATRSIAHNRNTDPETLIRQMRGDLDWITLKAMEKDRTRRYASASEFAADVGRYLRDEPILARPPSAAYRARKFVRRNRVLVASGASVMLALMAGLTASVVLYRRASSAARAEAQRADELKRVADFQASMLGQIDVASAGAALMRDIVERHESAGARVGSSGGDRAVGREALAAALGRTSATDVAYSMIDRTILTPAISAIDAQFRDQPLVAATLRQTLASVYQTLGKFGAARPLQEQALATFRRILGEDRIETVRAMNNMGMVLYNEGRFEEAEPYFQASLAGTTRLLGAEDPETLTSMSNVALLFGARGDFSKAEEMYRRVLAVSRRTLGAGAAKSIETAASLGVALQSQGRFPEAEEVLRGALGDARRSLGSDHPITLANMSGLGLVLMSAGRSAEAEPLLRELLERRRRMRGEEHPDTLNSLSNLGNALMQLRRYEEAEALFREAVEKSRWVLGGDHPFTLIAINSTGFLLLAQGKLDAADPFLVEALETRRRVSGEEHVDTLIAYNNLGRLRLEQGRYAEAEALLVPAAAKAEAKLPPQHGLRRVLPQYVARLYAEWEKAEPGRGHAEQFAAWQATTRPASEPGAGE